METDYNEDISGLNTSELKQRQAALERDKEFVQHKKNYWNEQSRLLYLLGRKLMTRQRELRGSCEICGACKTEEEQKKERLRTLPDGRRVCKKCWNHVADDTLLKNANNAMTGRIEI